MTRSITRPVARSITRGITEGIGGGPADPYGPELVVNGDFSDGGTGWDGVWGFSGGNAKFLGTGDTLSQDFSVTPGARYLISWYQSGGSVYYRLGGSGNLGVFSGAGNYSAEVVSPGTGALLLIQSGMTPDVDYIDDVSCKEVL